jgi:spore coat protein JB
LDKDTLLKQITVLCFMATDLHLYLNTHPDDKEALQMYNETVEKEQKARKAYEAACGPLSYGSRLENGWAWIDCPWPWQESFNYAHGKNVYPQAAVKGKNDWSAPYGEERL